jgi:hypothetical protein
MKRAELKLEIVQLSSSSSVLDWKPATPLESRKLLAV